MRLQAARSHVLANEQIRVTITDAGRLESVGNLLAAETYSFRADSFALDTDQGLFSNSELRPTRITAGKQRIVYHYEFSPDTPNTSRISAELVYTLSDSNGFFRRALSISNAAPLRVKHLVLGGDDIRCACQGNCPLPDFLDGAHRRVHPAPERRPVHRHRESIL
jgi:hypothetical protein